MQEAHQELNQSRLAHKTDASNAAGGAASSATAALGHAVGWLGAKLDPTTRHTYKQASVPPNPSLHPTSILSASRAHQQRVRAAATYDGRSAGLSRRMTPRQVGFPDCPVRHVLG